MIHPSKIIHELGIAPLKKLGQNFQIDTHVVANMASLIPSDAKILEIGPGLGAWTEVFLQRGHSMVLVEKDRTLAARLLTVYENNKKVEVVEGDFLAMPFDVPPISMTTAAVGNLPFYITSELLLRLIADCTFIKYGLFGVQLEVAERIAAAKGSSLAIALNAHGKLTLAGRIARTSFYPIPAVDAAILFFHREENLPRPHLRALLKAAFWGKRKTLASALRKNPFWSDESVAVSWNEKLTAIQQAHERIFAKRADDISVEEFFVVYDALNRS